MRYVRLVGSIALLAVAFAPRPGLKAYVSSGYAWGNSRVPYYINPNNLYLSATDVIAAIQSSASAWTTQAGVPVQLTYAGTTNASTGALDYVNNVFFRNDAPGPIAQTYLWGDSTGHLIDADIVFHENYVFYTHALEPCSGGYYVENTITHEFGHALGLYHSDVPTATMWATEDSCETIKETLDPDDIAGIQSLYPPKPTTTVTAPSAPSQLAAATSGATPSSSLNLSWVDTASNASGVRIERGTDGVSFSQVAQLGSTASSYTDSNLASGATYYYRVYAYNSAGTSSYSNVAYAQTQPLVSSTPSAPSAPTSPTPGNSATSVNTNVTLGWTAANASSYDVYIGDTLFASNLTKPSVSVSLTAGTGYAWTVVARNAVGTTQGPQWTFTTRSNANAGKKK